MGPVYRLTGDLKASTEKDTEAYSWGATRQSKHKLKPRSLRIKGSVLNLDQTWKFSSRLVIQIATWSVTAAFHVLLIVKVRWCVHRGSFSSYLFLFEMQTLDSYTIPEMFRFIQQVTEYLVCDRNCSGLIILKNHFLHNGSRIRNIPNLTFWPTYVRPV